MDPNRKARRVMIERQRVGVGLKAPTQEDVKTYLQQFGTVVEISAGEDKNIGFAEFSTTSEAEHALEKPYHKVLGCDVRLFAPATANLQK